MGSTEHRKRHNLAVRATLWLTAAAGIAHAWASGGAIGDMSGNRLVLFGTFVSLLLLLESRHASRLSGQGSFALTFGFTLLLIAPPALAIASSAICVGIGALTTEERSLGRSLTDAARIAVAMSAASMSGAAIAPLDGLLAAQEPPARWLAATLTAGAVLVVVAVSVRSVEFWVNGAELKRSLMKASRSVITADGRLIGLAPVVIVVGVNALILIPVLLVIVGVVLHGANAVVDGRRLAVIDGLTEIPNRRAFATAGAALLSRLGDRSESAAVLHLDLDGFKGINDRLGHDYGDGVLQEIARRLAESKRERDIVARLAGDEFGIVLAGVHTRDAAEAAARRIVALIEEPLRIDGIPLSVSASLGIALFPEHGATLDELLSRADVAMYRAKAATSGVAIYRAGETSAPGRMSLVSELGDALRRGDLLLHYQPKIDLRSGRIRTVEALLRWQHPQHGAVSPAWFMPVAEQTDLVGEITAFVLREALEQCARWQRRGIEVGVAVNASARNLHDLTFPALIAEILSSTGVPAALLEIEITENTIMEDPHRSEAVLRELRSLGVSVSIDDFGTGYSSLASLRNLTIDRIKIDRSFVTDLAERDADVTIVRSVVELGRNLGLSTVAEGVESDEVLHILGELGVDEFQGFLASKPLPAEELEPVLIHGLLDLTDRPTTDIASLQRNAIDGVPLA